MRVKTETINNGIPLGGDITDPKALPTRRSTQLEATGTPPGGAFSWSTSSDKVSLSSTSGSTITVTALKKSEAAGDVVITATYSVNGQSYTVQVPMTVQQPARFEYKGTTANEPLIVGERTRRGRQRRGWLKRINWQLKDHLGGDMYFRVPVADILVNNVPNTCLIEKMGIGTELSEEKGTGFDGGWIHTYTTNSSACVNGGNCSLTGYQRYTVNGFVLSDDDKDYVYTCNGIQLEGDGSTINQPTPPTRKRTSAFVDYFYMGSIEDLPSDAELQDWTNRLNTAAAQGRLLDEAKVLGRALFQSSDYASRNRSDEDYVADLYLAYLQRAPDPGGYAFWLDKLRYLNAQGQNGREILLREGFEPSTEFQNLVNSLEVGPPPNSCDITLQQECYNNGGSWDQSTCSCTYYPDPDPDPDPCYRCYPY